MDCTLSREIVAISMIVFLGVSFLVPGIIMRLEDVTSPTPYMNVNLCAAGGNRYASSPSMCNATNVVFSSQNIPLNQVVFTNGVGYVPAILRSDALASGSITVSLLDASQNNILSFTQSLDSSSLNSKVIELSNVHSALTKVQMYRALTSYPSQNKLCDDVQYGCSHILRTALNKLILTDKSFLISAPPSADVFSQFTSNMTLVVQSAEIVMKPNVVVQPELYIMFQQESLSTLQHRGVVFLNVGFGVIFFALALYCFHSFFQRRKRLSNANKGLPTHYD
eukprot:TRINITY_DN341_c0_g1_i1.p1 TRINITY_DN341_c0_g1~~TRINITY_DN341_c0_g1_i1.p1  ORF type:complete len:280 (-),score=78.62 TRINITY_DN341_c0_g1_i1:34-873(-)